MARALRFQGSILLSFSGDCVLATVYLIKRLSSVVLDGKSLYEVFHGITPCLHYLRVLGCLCFATITAKTDKFSPRAISIVQMGYSTTKGLQTV